MRTLDQLREVIDDIQAQSEWDYEFVTDLLAQQDEGRDFSKHKLTAKQFTQLQRIVNTYIAGWK